MANVNKETLQTVNSMMGNGQTKAMLPAMPGVIYGPGMDTAGAASGMAFLQGSLEKQDLRILEPLSNITAPDDITMVAGGGWVEFTSQVFADYATTGNDEDSIITGETTNIPTSNANISKDLYSVYTFAEALRVPFVDEAKLQQVGRSLAQLLDTGLRLNYNKLIDRNVYVGIAKAKTYGLVNNPAVTAASAANGVSGSPLWANKTPDEIVNDVNQLLIATWAASEYDLTGMADTILISPQRYGYLVQQKVSAAGNISILEYVLKNNIAVNQGRKLTIKPRRWCIGAGVGTTERMVAYVNSEDRVHMNSTVPLSRVMTAPNTQSMSYETVYAAQFGQTKVLFYQCIRYADGI